MTMSHQSTPNDNVFDSNTKNCKVYDFLVPPEREDLQGDVGLALQHPLE